MRTAEQTHVWLAVRNSPRRDIALKSFSFRGIAGLTDDLITFSSPITAICGVNGTGKTALLRGILALIQGPEFANAPEIVERLKGFSGELLFDTPAGSVPLRLPGEPGNAIASPAAVFHIDTSLEAAKLQRDVCAIPEIEEVLEPHEAIVLSEIEKGTLSYILNKQYERVAIYEIDDYGDERAFPIVMVTENGASYDTRTMSLGEISVFSIFFELHRASQDSIVLLEEPETYLSPVSQGALMDYLAKVCIEKKLTLILTTHSPPMFSRLSSEQIRFTYRSFDNAALASPEQFETMRAAVGLTRSIDRILLVEDRAAREFTSALVGKFDYEIMLRSEIVDTEGHGKITAFFKLMKNVKVRAFKFIGVYDGDSYQEITRQKPEGIYVFLPGDLPLEQTFRTAAEEATTDFASNLGRNEESVKILLAKLRGRNYHDWFEDLNRELHMSYAEVMHACIEIWLKDEYNRAQAENFFYDLRKQL